MATPAQIYSSRLPNRILASIAIAASIPCAVGGVVFLGIGQAQSQIGLAVFVSACFLLLLFFGVRAWRAELRVDAKGITLRGYIRTRIIRWHMLAGFETEFQLTLVAWSVLVVKLASGKRVVFEPVRATVHRGEKPWVEDLAEQLNRCLPPTGAQ